MKAARNKIAEQAKQRDCTQRMETQLISVSHNVETFVNMLYVVQTETARKPLSKTHSVIIQGENNLYELFFELHKVTTSLNFTAISGDDDLLKLIPNIRKALDHHIDLDKDEVKEKGVDEDDN